MRGPTATSIIISSNKIGGATSLFQETVSQKRKKMSVREETSVHTETTEPSTSSTTRTSASERRIAPLAAVLFLYKGFLELPVPAVILSLWLASTALIGLGILTLYYLFWVLVELLVGL